MSEPPSIHPETSATAAYADREARRLSSWLLALAVINLCAALAGLAFVAVRTLNHDLEPQVRKTVAMIADTIRTDLERAGGIGMPLREIPGMGSYLAEIVAEHTEIAYAVLTSPDRQVLAATAPLSAGLGLADSASGVLPTPELVREITETADALTHHIRSPDLPTGHQGAFVTIPPFTDYVLPLTVNNHLIGRLHLGIDGKVIERHMGDALADVLITLFVSVVVALEVLWVMAALTISRPLRLLAELAAMGARADFTHYVGWRSRDEIGRLIDALNRLVRGISERYEATLIGRKDADLLRHNDAGTTVETPLGSFKFKVTTELSHVIQHSPMLVRLPVFIYFFGLELSRPFFPLYVDSLYQPVPFLTREMVIALPASIWVLAMLLATPMGGVLARHVTARGLIAFGMLPSVVGLAMTGVAHGVYDLMLWRAMTAAGMGITTMATLLYVTKTTPPDQRARGMAVLVGASVAASLGATAIGGILAERIGMRQAFFVASGLTALAMLFAWHILRDVAVDVIEAPKNRLSVRRFLSIFLVWRAILIFIFSGASSRIVLTGLFGFLTPLYLHQQGFDKAEIGRVMMCFFLVMVVATPVVASMADRYRCHRLFLILGGAASAAGAFAFAEAGDVWGFVLALSLIGLGQALVGTTQMALVPEILKPECDKHGLSSVMAVFRLVDRLGSVAGPMLIAGLMGLYGVESTGLIIGVGLVVATVLLATSWRQASALPVQAVGDDVIQQVGIGDAPASRRHGEG